MIITLQSNYFQNPNDKSQINTDSEKHLDVPALTFCDLAKFGDIATVVSAKKGLLIIIIIIMGLESVSASEDVIGDLPSP